MDVAQITALTDRLNQLETTNQGLARECRRWRRVGMGALAAGLLVAFCGANLADADKTVEASHFVLRDEAGRMRAALGMRPDGTPGLGLFDLNGQVRLSFDLASSGSPGVNLYDKAGTLQAALAVRPDGTPGFGLFDGEGKVRLSLDLSATQAPGVNLFDQATKVRGAFAIRPDGLPSLGLFDEQGQVRLSLDAKTGANSPAVPAAAAR